MNMILLFHISIALASVAYTTYIFFAPSEAKLKASYALVTLTLASGTYLVWSTHAQILQACMSGLAYVGAVSIGLVAVRRKLAREHVSDKTQ
jgi:hypothetical protein